MTAIVLLTI